MQIIRKVVKSGALLLLFYSSANFGNILQLLSLFSLLINLSPSLCPVLKKVYTYNNKNVSKIKIKYYV